MASIGGVYASGTAYRLDDLCPACYLPAIWAIPVHFLRIDGAGYPTITLSGIVRICADCKYRYTTKGPL